MKIYLKKIAYIFLGFCFLIVTSALGYAAYQYYSSRNISSDEIQNADNYFNEAKQLYENKEYSKTIEKVKDAISLNPNKAEYYILISDVYRLKNRYDLELEFLKSIEGNIRYDDQIQRRLGYSYCKNNNIDSCLSILSKHFNSETPSFEDYGLIKQYVLKTDYDSLKIYLSEISECSNTYEYKMIVLKTIVNEDNLDTSLSYLTSCSELLVEENFNYLTELNKLKESLLTSEDKELKLNIVKANWALAENYPKISIKVLSDNPKLYDVFWESSYISGVANLQIGNTDTANEYYQKTITLNPYDYHPYWLYAQIKDKNNKADEAILAYQKATTWNTKAIDLKQDFINFCLNRGFSSELEEQYTLLNRIENIDYEIILKNSIQIYLYFENKDENKANSYLNLVDNTKFNTNIDKELINIYYLYLFSESVQNGDIEKVKAGISEGKFTEEAYELYIEALISEYEGDNDKSQELFKKCIDIDTNGEVSKLADKKIIKTL